MDWNSIYKSRIMTAEEAVRIVKSGDRIFLTGNVSVPPKSLAALVAGARPSLNFRMSVVTSLVIHHLVTEDKRRAFKEIYRVLKPQGRLCVVDFGAPHSVLTRFIVAYMRHLEEVADNFDGLIPHFMTEAGFGGVREAKYFVTIFGPLSLWQAVKG